MVGMAGGFVVLIPRAPFPGWNGCHESSDGSLQVVEYRDSPVQAYGSDCVHRGSSVGLAPVTRKYTLWAFIRYRIARIPSIKSSPRIYWISVNEASGEGKLTRPALHVGTRRNRGTRR